VGSESFWASRLRWRLRGAWMWPAFAALTLIDAVLLHELPPISTGVDPVPALLIATFANLFIVGALAPWLIWLLERRAHAAAAAAPREVTLDRMATALLCAGALGIVAAGLAGRESVVVETEAREINAREVDRYLAAHAPEDVRRNRDASNTARLAEEGYFRNCVPYEDRRRQFCFFVDTKTEPPTVRRDPSTLNNHDFLRGPSSP
jgi:hypothetical protein